MQSTSKKKNVFLSILFWLVLLFLVLYITIRMLFPSWLHNLPRIQFYTVLSSSMEPNIPTYSLLCVRQFAAQEKISLEPGTIITFQANRLGHEIVITHYLYATEENTNGELIYRTIAEGVETPDAYQTTRQDLVGVYLFHIPTLGKVLLFLKSKFALILLGEECIILLANQLIQSFWQEKEQKRQKVNSTNQKWLYRK